ncbi:unnamed protein product [Lactuca virosa]|uniref:Ubiquitin-like protease family profile domain-containing protein n=1 Tax=Lactuca virosa TaxID=75947 RepID=A0AAU9N335_9ASTR|nr:unnamed protein product [Lactuca virosa]
MKIVSTNKAYMNFRMNFIALLINSLIESSSSGKANTNPLYYITSKTKIENIDSCSYLIDCLVKNKQSFDPSNPTSNFNGPSAYLVLLYLDRIKSDVLNIERTLTGQENENLKGGEEQQRKNKDKGGEDIKITDGEKDENDNNDQGLDYMNLNDEGVENEKGGDNEEQNVEGEGVEGMNIQGKNAKKVEEITGEQPQRDGEDVEKDENDNNDQGLDYMNLNDEGVENEKGGDNEEQNVEGEGVEGMNIEEKNAKKVEEITGEQPQRDGEAVEGMNIERKNDKKLEGITGEQPQRDGEGFDDINLHDEGVENEKGGDNEEQNVEGEEDVNKTITNVIESIFENTSEFSITEMLNDDEFNSVYEKTMKEYQDKKEESMMPSYDLKISQLTPPEMTENTAGQKKDEGEKENLVKDALDPKAKTHPKQNVTLEHRKQRKKKPAEVRRSPYKERAICLKTKLTKEEEMLGEWLFHLQGTEYDQLLFTINKRVVFRYVFEIFFPGEYLFPDVIDSWSELLNYNDKDRDINNSPYRVFLSVQITTKYIEDEQLPKPKKDDKRKKIDKKVKEQMEKEAKEKGEYRYNLFKKYFVDWFNGDEEKIKLKDVDLIFFPVCREEHMFLYIFNIKNPNIVILDNSRSDATVKGKYMETYMAQPEYKTGFPKEGAQDALLDLVRTKYAHALIDSEINFMKDDVMELAHEYNKQNKEKKESDQRNACAEIHQRLSDCQ